MSQSPANIVVTTLGTGTPVPDPERCSQSILVEAGGLKLLFDAGRNVLTRLTQAGVNPADVEQVFFTHFHSDHTVGFADFWLTSWIPAGGARTTPLRVTGPRGSEALVNGHRMAFADDIRIRMADQGLPKSGVEVIVDEFSDEGVVYERDGVVVRAFDVDHGEAIKPNFGYRIDYQESSVVISGDAQNDPRVADVAAGVDLLFHSAGGARAELLQRPEIAAILQHHTTPQEAGRIFKQASPKLASLVHMVRIGRPGFSRLTADEIVNMVREVYDGDLIVAEDLMRFEVSGEGVTVRTHQDQ